jgi:Plasmid pRiA4b ORF-3-like protein
MTAIVRLKVTLEDVEPEVMRRLDVPPTIRLDRLHRVLQAAMGWTNVTLRRRPPMRAG